jgi:hypothetical protein
MITEHIDLILLVTGCITSVVTLQFFFPKLYANKILKIELVDDVSRFYFAHWGLVVLSISIMLVCASFIPEMQKPVAFATLIEKAPLAFLVFKDRKKPYAKMMLPAAMFDTVCSVLYALFLLGF